MKTAGRYVIIRRHPRKEKTEGGLYLAGNDDKPHSGTVISHPDEKFDGATMLYTQVVKEVDGYDIVQVEAILCVVMEAA